MDKTEKLKLMQDKLHLFQKEKTPIHVVLVDIKKFYNGLVVKISEDYFVLMDKKAGKINIFFSEIFKLEKYIRK